MTDVKTIDTLEVYLLANELSDEIWNLVSVWSHFEKDTIGKQVVRSADSISANIAEGYGRFSYKENRQFCFYARGSILETKTWLLKAKNRNLIAQDVYENLFSKLELTHIKLNAYMKYIGKTKKE
ncbi:MAG: four helix bundle protein [Bacteroidia bacterium]